MEYGGRGKFLSWPKFPPPVSSSSPGFVVDNTGHLKNFVSGHFSFLHRMTFVTAGQQQQGCASARRQQEEEKCCFPELLPVIAPHSVAGTSSSAWQTAEKPLHHNFLALKIYPVCCISIVTQFVQTECI